MILTQEQIGMLIADANLTAQQRLVKRMRRKMDHAQLEWETATKDLQQIETKIQYLREAVLKRFPNGS